MKLSTKTHSAIMSQITHDKIKHKIKDEKFQGYKIEISSIAPHGSIAIMDNKFLPELKRCEEIGFEEPTKETDTIKILQIPRPKVRGLHE